MPAPYPIRSRLGLLCLAALLAAGCEKTSGVTITPEVTPSFGPHGGPVAALPGGGLVEVANEAAGSQSRLLAFFYADNAMAAPLSASPADVRIDLAMPGGESTAVSLTPSAGDGARFASEPGDYAFDPLVGTLNATVGGQPASVPFSGAQS